VPDRTGRQAGVIACTFVTAAIVRGTQHQDGQVKDCTDAMPKNVFMMTKEWRMKLTTTHSIFHFGTSYVIRQHIMIAMQQTGARRNPLVFDRHKFY
jgi:hypothetical protein